MGRIHITLLAAAVALSGSSAALAQSRKMTEQDRLQMQKEIAWDKQQKLKADRDAQTTYTEKCQMVGGRMTCQGAQPANTVQSKPAAGPQARTPVAPSQPANKPTAVKQNKIVPIDGKLGTAYNNQKNNLLDAQVGYEVNTYTKVTPNKPSTNTYAPYVSRKYISQ